MSETAAKVCKGGKMSPRPIRPAGHQFSGRSSGATICEPSG